MMNRSKIEYCDYTWNPITGCHHDCPYCYARKQAVRFSGDVRLNKMSEQLKKGPENGLWVLDEPFKNGNGKVIPYPAGFEPCLHTYRMNHPVEKPKPSTIFVGAVTDLFGEWVPDQWINEVMKTVSKAPWHNYIFLTKNPGRYSEYFENSWQDLPDEYGFEKTVMFCGTSITCQDDLKMIHRQSMMYLDFLSIEPIQGEIDLSEYMYIETEHELWGLEWVIIGAETGSQTDKVIPERKWIESIVSHCREAGIPVFLKNNLAAVWGDDLIQEYPKELKRKAWHRMPGKRFVEKVSDAPRKKSVCRQCGKPMFGEPAWSLPGMGYVCVECYENDKS